MPRKTGLIICILVAILLISLFGCTTATPTEQALTINYENVLKEVPYGTRLSLSGLEVISKLSDGSYRTVPKGGDKGYVVDDGGYDPDQAGEYTITISYKDFEEAVFTITVLEEEIIDESQQTDIVEVGIAVKKFEGKRLFYVGEDFSTQDMIVLLLYSDGSSEPLDSARYNVDSAEYNGDKVGEYTITIRYYGYYGHSNYTDSYVVSVIKPLERQLVKIGLKLENVQREFLYGDIFDYSGLIVEKYYDDGDIMEVEEATADEFTITAPTYDDNPDMLMLLGTNEISVNIKGTDIIATYEIEVNDYISGINAIINYPIFYIGEDFDESRIDVYIIMASGSQEKDEDLEAYVINSDNFDSTQEGEYEIEVRMKDNPEIVDTIEVRVTSN